MHNEILTKKQTKMLPWIKLFNKDFGLVDGTAIALLVGHRQSIDFDLFSLNDFKNAKIRKITAKNNFKIDRTYRDESGHYTLIINKVLTTFFFYPFKITFTKNFDNIIHMPDLLTLAAMKAYALGRRPKWKDYVDLYFILTNFHSINKIEKRANKIFKKEFNSKLFRIQLSYFDDINYSEKIDYLSGFEVSDKKIKKSLIEFSLEK